MTPQRFKKLHQILSQRQTDLTVIADKVHKGRNLAAIARTCDAVGIDTIHSVMPEAGYKPYRGTALGAEKWVEVALYDAFEEPLGQLRNSGFQLVATALSAETIDFRDVDYCKPTALVLGSEIKGVSDSAQAEADVLVSIPMMGMVESYNVSVAAAIILLEAQRQRSAAGMYDESRMDPGLYQRRFFKWAHPVIAEYCDKNGLEYPPLREDGEIIEASAWYASVR